MQYQWNDHTLEVTGDWTGRWLFLAPEYELAFDGESVDRTGGPRIKPTLGADIEYDDGETHHLEARITSIFGFRPRCELFVDDQPVASDHIRVANILNPFLMLLILVSTAVMLYVGPDILREHLPFV